MLLLPVLPGSVAPFGGQPTTVCITAILTPSMTPILPSQKFSLESYPWFMTDYALPTFLKEIPDWVKFKELRFINRYDWIAVLFWPLVATFLVNGQHSKPWTGTTDLDVGLGLLLAYCAFIPCHIFGKFTHSYVWKKEIRNRDESRNNWLVSIITFGEGWHNNHHFLPGSARQGFLPGDRPTTTDFGFFLFFGQ